jgi:hypothetical protein
MAVYDSIALGLEFSFGIALSKEIKRIFASTVHPGKNAAHFTMVVSFGRSSFRLTEKSVGLALEAATGGYCGMLQVSFISERVYSFAVSNKDVAFHILNKRSFTCSKFKCFFHLWGAGGPNWRREFHLWQKECAQEWTLISPNKRRTSLGVSALAKPKPKSAIKHSEPIRKKLVFAEKIHYEAHKGYAPVESKDSNAHLHWQWTKTQPPIKFGTTVPLSKDVSLKETVNSSVAV